MPKSIPRTYSSYTLEALELLSKLIRSQRIEKGISTLELSERAGISRGLLQRIEKADPKCEIGVVFEVAKLVGVELFEMGPSRLKSKLNETSDRLKLLPRSVRSKKKRELDDDF